MNDISERIVESFESRRRYARDEEFESLRMEYGGVEFSKF